MCGRFGLSYPRATLVNWYRASAMPDIVPRYNIAPTTDIVVIRDNEAGRAGSMMRWGLIPHWAKETRTQPLLHNARSETIAEKPAFRNSFHHWRCIIPASGFYEWQRLPDGRKQPFFICARDGNPLSFAGIWSSCTTAEGVIVNSCTIVTTDCNALMQPIHDRMPVILQEDAWDTWLTPAALPDTVLLALLQKLVFDKKRLQKMA